jgi:hypothetical protein
MRIKSLVHCGLSLFVIANLLTAVAWSADSDDDVPNKVKMSLISLERAAEYPPPPNSAMMPGNGNEFVVIKFKFQAPSADDVIKEAKLFDADGMEHSCASSYVNFSPGKTTSGNLIFIFTVPKGMKLKSFLIGTETIDLSKIKETQTGSK